MMKITLCICMVLFFIVTPAFAVDYSEYYSVDQVERDVPSVSREATQGMSAAGGQNALEKGIGNLWRMGVRVLKDSVGSELKTVFALFLIAGFCAALGSFCEGAPANYVSLAGVLAMATLTLTGLNSLLHSAGDALSQISMYSKTLLPTLAALSAASGAPTSAAAMQAITALFCDMLITLYERLLTPLLYMYAALLTANAAVPRLVLERVAQFIKWMLGGILTMTMVVFTAYLAISGAITGQADALAVKSAKAVLSGSVPVVGRIIADAAETVLVGTGLIRASAGIFGLVAVLGVILSPAAVILVRYLCFKLGGALIATVGDSALGRYADSLSGLFSLMLGVLCSAAFLMVIAVVAFMQSGV